MNITNSFNRPGGKSPEQIEEYASTLRFLETYGGEELVRSFEELQDSDPSEQKISDFLANIESHPAVIAFQSRAMNPRRAGVFGCSKVSVAPDV